MALPVEDDKRRSTAFPNNPPPPGRVYGQSQRGLGAPTSSPQKPGSIQPLDTQAESDRQAFGAMWDKAKSLNQHAGAAIADVATLPLRAAAGVYDTAVVRPMRAAGINAAWTSPMVNPASNADGKSMTPFLDQMASKDAQTGVAAPSPVHATYSNEGRNYPASFKAAAAPTETPLPAGAPTATRNFSADLRNAPSTLPTDLPQGVIHKTVDANGRPVYSGANVGFGAKMVDGAGREVAQRGSVDVAQAGSMVAGAGGYGFTPASGQDQAGAQARQTQISQALTNPDGSKWSAQDNATMAANLRDSVDPYRGTSRSPQLTPGQTYAQQAMNAPRTLKNLTPRQMARIQDQALQIDAQAQTNRFNADRLGMDLGRLDLERQRLSSDIATGEMAREEKGLGIASAKQVADLQSKLLAATDPTEKAKYAQTLRELLGKQAQGDWSVQVTPATKNIDGSTTAGSVIRYNKATGQVEKVDGMQPEGTTQATAGQKYAVGQTVQRADGAKARVTAVDENGNPTAFQPL